MVISLPAMCPPACARDWLERLLLKSAVPFDLVATDYVAAGLCIRLIDTVRARTDHEAPEQGLGRERRNYAQDESENLG